MKNEKKILKLLNGIENLPKYLFDFNEWENYYLVETKLEGLTFFEANNEIEWANIPIKIIMKKSLELIKRIHKWGVIVNDISSNNFLINKNKNKIDVSICDFGSSYCMENATTDLQIKGITKGFYSSLLSKLNHENSDFHKLGYLLMSYIFPIIGFNEIDASGKLLLDKFKIFCNLFNVDYFVEQVIIELVLQEKGYLNRVEDLMDKIIDGYVIKLKYEDKKTKFFYTKIFSDIKNIFVKSDKHSFEYMVLLQKIKRNKTIYDTIIEHIINENVVIESFDTLYYIKNISLEFGLCNLAFKYLNGEKEIDSIQLKKINKLFLEELNIDDIKDISLSNGLLGIALFDLKMYRNSKKQIYLKHFFKIMNHIVSKIICINGEYHYTPSVGIKRSSPYIYPLECLECFLFLCMLLKIVICLNK